MGHPTNAVRVRFLPSGRPALWYEPPCLECLAESAPPSSEPPICRLLVGQRVRLNRRESPYHCRIGLIQLHFHLRDYSVVTVRFSDGHEEYVRDSQVSVTTSLH